MSYERIRQMLRQGDVIILDGGTGTDIQRRGVPMSGDTWCADANLDHGDAVRAVHADYVRAGADIVTANTFATSPLLFTHIGRASEVPRIDRLAVQHARAAVGSMDVAVAGSMSTMRPMQSGSDRNNLLHHWSEDESRALFTMKADGLKAAGVDFIMMEMMRDTDYAVYASEAALSTGLPVWIGLSAERGENGVLQGWGRADCAFDDIAKVLAALRPEVMCIMHTSPNDTDDAIKVLKRHWHGPIGVYPESGYFKSPDWEFVDVIAPAELVIASKRWQDLGATAFGGCCGIGPDHIAALAREIRK
jgi:homocysteine S-methyltransferase